MEGLLFVCDLKVYTFYFLALTGALLTFCCFWLIALGGAA